MPLLMVLAEWRWRATRDPVYLELAKRWAKGTAILFCRWRRLWNRPQLRAGSPVAQVHGDGGPDHRHAFLPRRLRLLHEAIFLGIYLYGWERIPPKAHIGAGILVALSGVLSGIFVVIANAWMNTPQRFHRGLRPAHRNRSDSRDAEPCGISADAAHDPSPPMPLPVSRSRPSTVCSSSAIP
jgi:cytochrome d ubiquinol oxidase subunit I